MENEEPIPQNMSLRLEINIEKIKRDKNMYFPKLHP